MKDHSVAAFQRYPSGFDAATPEELFERRIHVFLIVYAHADEAILFFSRSLKIESSAPDERR
jgi:hypothetical protein